VKKFKCALSRKTFVRICSASFFSSMMQIYAIEGYKDFPMYFVGGLIVLAVANLLTHNKRSGWLIDCVVLSVFFVVFGNFGISSLLWVLWITLIGFVFLRSKPDFKILNVVATNLILFVTLFSVVELPLRFSENPDDHPNFNLGVDSKSQNFVKLSAKSYFKKALEQSKNDSSVLGPNREFIDVMTEQIKSSGDLVFLDDYPGNYIKIQTGRRLTVGSTGIRQKRVLVFGGSTVFCAEVPDSMTIPSQLQKLILDNKFDLDVLNYGIPGIRIENQLKILETIGDIGPGDVVVFYDGINDLNTVFRLGLESNKSVIPLGFVKEVAAWVESHSLLARGLISGYIDSSGISKDFLSNDAENEVADLWVKNDKGARSYVESKGAKFVHILQPNWVTYQGGVEATKDNKRWSDMRSIQNYFEKYSTSVTKIENFTKKLDGLSSTPYIDWAHLDEIGNKKIAEEMFAVLEPLLVAQGK
jgi:hypothetical protein